MTDQHDTRQIDFYQAMTDFKQMFPLMDEEVIEAVLRSNNGAVDDTIDQLLTMCVDTGDGPVTRPSLPTDSALRESESYYVNQNPTAVNLDTSTSSEEDVGGSTQPPAYLPPASGLEPPTYNEYMRKETLHLPVSLPSSTSSSANSTNNTSRFEEDLLRDFTAPVERLFESEVGGATGGSPLPNHVDEAEEIAALPPPPPLPPQMSLLEHDYAPKPRKPVTHTPFHRRWNPPLLGKLPHDFLRITIDIPEAPPPPLPSHRRSHCRHSRRTPSPSRAQAVLSRSATLPEKASRSGSWSEKGSKSATTSATTRREHRRKHIPDDPQLNSSLIQQKMAENERKRSEVHAEVDPTGAQLLEDERLAIVLQGAMVLQNEEFLRALRQNKDFMKTLEKDRMNATAFEPVKTDSEANKSTADTQEGYGDDLSDQLQTFPFDQTVPKDDNAEFRQQLNQMGGSSRKKFTDLARKFFTKKKKVPTATLR